MAKEEPKLGVLPPGHIREFDFAAKLFESLRNTPVHRDDTGRNDMDAAARNELYETCMRMAPQMLRDCRLFDLTEGMRASDEDGESVPVCVDNLPFPVVGIRTGYRCLGEESAPALAVVAEANPADPGPGDSRYLHAMFVTMLDNTDTLWDRMRDELLEALHGNENERNFDADPVALAALRDTLAGLSGGALPKTRAELNDAQNRAIQDRFGTFNVLAEVMYGALEVDADGQVHCKSPMSRLIFQKQGDITYYVHKRESMDSLGHWMESGNDGREGGCYMAYMQSVAALTRALKTLSDPSLFALEGAATEKVEYKGKRAKQLEKRRIRRSTERPIYVLLKPKQIREALNIKQPGAEPGSKVGPHERRGHHAYLRHERYARNPDGSIKRIWRKHSWIGPSEAVIDRRIYRVILDRPEDKEAVPLESPAASAD